VSCVRGGQSGVRCRVSGVREGKTGVRGQVSGVRGARTGAGCQVSGFWCQVRRVGVWGPGLGCQVRCFGCRGPGFGCQVRRVGCWGPGFRCQAHHLGPYPSPLGRGWTATALSPAVAGRVRGFFLSQAMGLGQDSAPVIVSPGPCGPPIAVQPNRCSKHGIVLVAAAQSSRRDFASGILWKGGVSVTAALHIHGRLSL
jgi:hypothetical protein